MILRRLYLFLFSVALHAQFLQQGAKLVGFDSAAQGASVAVSGDGNTALVGGIRNSRLAAAWVYVRTNGVWNPQGPPLAAIDASGPAVIITVALSADGNTALMGSQADNGNVGAAFVFVRTNDTWTQQGPRLLGLGSGQGRCVSLSADGNTALVGGPGAVNIFTRTGGVWTRQATLPLGTGAAGDASQGLAAALSGDGNTAIVGGNSDNLYVGAAWVYARVNGVWSQQGPKLTGNDAVGTSAQGTSLALSADGSTAAVGGDGDNGAVGAAWIYTRANGVWTQQGPKLVGAGAVGKSGQGGAVSLSADGNTLLVSGRGDNQVIGAGWSFTRANGVWTQLGSKFVGTGYSGVPPFSAPQEGWSVALSADGHTAVLGGPGDQPVGAAWVFVSAAVHFSVSVPASVTAGVPFQFTVTALNPDSSVATGYTGTVHFVTSDPQAVLPPDASLTNGAGTFTATLQTVSSNSVVTVTDTVNQTIAGASGPVAVVPGLTTHFAISAAPPSVNAGSTFSFTVSAFDQFGNFAPGNTSRLRFSSTDPAAILPGESTLPGTATFSAIFRTTGNQTITAIDTGNSSITGTSNVISVASSTGIVNLAVGRPASQSSTFDPNSVAALAVDGNTDGNFFNGSVTATATRLETFPWWQVDLGSSANVSSVVVWNRTDCCGTRLNDYWVFVSDTPFLASDTPLALQSRAGTFASHQTVAPGPSATISVGAQGRYVRVQLNGPGYLSLAEVQVMGTAAPSAATSLSLGKTATQSSTLPGYPTAGASAAVDGSTDGNFFHGSVTATDLNTNAWWQVDLGSNATVNSVLISNRTDCCGTRLNDYWVFVSNTPFSDTDTPATLQNRGATFAVHQTTTPDSASIIAIGGTAGFVGRYVRVQLNRSGYLSLAEVQVFGTGAAGDTNVAVGKAAAQSSTLPGYPTAVAGAAVDGNTNGSFFSGSVTATDLNGNAWWQVDLGSSFTISSVAIWNRTDCCGTRLNNFSLLVSNTPFPTAGAPTFVSHQTFSPAPSTAIPVGVQGRYVRIQLDGTDYLSLAEVQVLGH